MEQLIQLFITLPILGFLISLFLPSKNEKAISVLSITVTGVHFVGCLAFTGGWLWIGFPTLDVKEMVLYESGAIEIFIDFFFDKATAVFSITGSFLAFIVTIFSRYYLHRDPGFKRFFTNILLFFAGYNLVVFSGNFETLFLGWEILGVCSFLLIAFFRDRYLPEKNSLKVISIFRLGDICLMLAMWMGHHLWHENITYIKLHDPVLVAEHFKNHYYFGYFIAAMIVIAAAVKSAQLPFSSWLPRAMEGPTTSSAIFYGSLSVHLGAFLLLRTYPYWEGLLGIRIAVVLLGLSSALVATSIGRVQSTVKTQIAYASIAQIGLIFIEIALGFHMLALLHFMGNALLRTYQLLVSPSVMHYLTHEKFFNFIPSPKNQKENALGRIKNALYILSVKEWSLDFFLYRFLWNPFKWTGDKFRFLTGKVFFAILMVVFLAGVYIRYSGIVLPEIVTEYLPVFFSLTGLIAVLKAFTERGDALKAWMNIFWGQLFIVLSVALLNEDFTHHHISWYLSGTVVSAIVGYFCLRRIKAIDEDIELNRFHGYISERPRTAFLFLLSSLGFAGLPLTTSFIGLDVLYSHIHKHEEGMVIFTSLSFLVMEVSILRIYSRIFLGQYKKATKAMAYRSS